jgi:hypothetical protein
MPETLLQVTRPTEFSLERLAAAPLVINYILTSEVTIQTTVIGDARNIASVAIIDGSVTVWSTTLTQASPNAETPYALQLGSIKIDAGAGLHLTIPTSIQNGNVVLEATIEQASNPPQPFAAQVASWPLTGSAS